MRTIAYMLSTLLAAGCAADEVGPVEGDGLQQGLSLFTRTPEAGLTGMYARGDLAVFFETIREVNADPAPQHEQYAVDGTPLDVSARFTDMEGRNLYVSIASHLQPDLWTAPGEPSPAALAARSALFDLAEEAGAALQAATLEPDILPEVAVLASMGQTMRPPPIVPPDAAETAVWSGGWDHWQYFEVHSASCCGIAEHSATVFWNWSWSYGWEDGWQTNNHGRWATEMGLEGDCGGSGSWSGGSRPHFYSDKFQYCATTYAACTGLLVKGYHNCHDDSKIQRKNINCDQTSGVWSGICTNGGCDMYAPGCGGCNL